MSDDTSETHQVSLLLECGWNVWQVDGTPMIIKNGQVQPIKRETVGALLWAGMIRVHQRYGTVVRFARTTPEQKAKEVLIDITDARNYIDVRETVTTPDYQVKWQVVFTVGKNPECVIATCDTPEEASDEANRFGECLKKLIAAIVQ